MTAWTAPLIASHPTTPIDASTTVAAQSVATMFFAHRCNALSSLGNELVLAAALVMVLAAALVNWCLRLRL